jgi:hypothetical protein
LLGILVWDGTDEIVAPDVDDLVGMRSDDDLVDQQLGQCYLITDGCLGCPDQAESGKSSPYLPPKSRTWRRRKWRDRSKQPPGMLLWSL